MCPGAFSISGLFCCPPAIIRLIDEVVDVQRLAFWPFAHVSYGDISSGRRSSRSVLLGLEMLELEYGDIFLRCKDRDAMNTRALNCPGEPGVPARWAFYQGEDSVGVTFTLRLSDGSFKKSSYPRQKMEKWVQQAFKESGASRVLLEGQAETVIRELRELLVFGELTEVG